MWVCQKCQVQVTEPSKICRSCGGILDEVPSPGDEPADAEGVRLHCGENVTGQSDLCRNDSMHTADYVPRAGDEPVRPDWVCPDCGESVPGTFDVCWNCAAKSSDGQGADAAHVSGPVKEIGQDTEALTGTESEIDEQPTCVTTQCPRCGSTKIIPDLTVVDQGYSSDGRLKTVVFGSPQALLFKDRLYGEIKADICGACGHVELHVANPNQLYRRYQKSRGLDRPSNLRQRWAVPCRSCRMLITTGSGSCPHCGAVQED